MWRPSVGKQADVAEVFREPGKGELTFDQSNVSRSRTFLRFLGSELDALSFAEQLKHSATN